MDSSDYHSTNQKVPDKNTKLPDAHKHQTDTSNPLNGTDRNCSQIESLNTIRIANQLSRFEWRCSDDEPAKII